MKKLIIAVAGVAAILLLGCSAILDGITPCYIDPEAVLYSGLEPSLFLPFTTLWDSQRVSRGMDLQFAFAQMKYGFLKDTAALYQASSAELQTNVLQPALMALIGGSTFTVGWLGVKRPGDKAKKTA